MLDAAGEMRGNFFLNEPIQGSAAAQTYIRQTTTNQTRAYQVHDSATMLLDMFKRALAGRAGHVANVSRGTCCAPFSLTTCCPWTRFPRKLVLVTMAMAMVMIADDGKADADYCGGSGGWRHGVLLGASIPSTRNLLVGPCISGH